MAAKPLHQTGKCRSACGKVHSYYEAASLNEDHPLLTAIRFAGKHGLDQHTVIARQALYEQVPWIRKLSPEGFESALKSFASWTEGQSPIRTWDDALIWANKVRAHQLWSKRDQFTPGRADKLFWEAG